MQIYNVVVVHLVFEMVFFIYNHFMLF